MPSTPPPRPFGALLTAMVTPFHADGRLDLEAAAELAVHLVDSGCDGLIVSGTTGEAPTTTNDEKDALLRAVLEAVGERASVVAGVGTNDTAHSVELAQAAAKAGAHGLLAVTPYYSKPPQAGLVRHFQAVADATDVPVMLYDIPGRTATPLEDDTLATLAEHPRIVAVKDAKGSLYSGSWVMQRTGLAYYSGDDPLNLAWLTHGAAGLASVVAHVAAPQYRRMIEAVDTGDLDGARALHHQTLPAVRGLMTRLQGAVAAKAALELKGRLANRTMRSPLIEATDEEVVVLRTDLEQSGVL